MCLEDRAGGRSSDSIVVTLSARLEKHYCNDHGLPGLCSEGACRVQAEVNLLQEMEMYMPYITAEAFKHLVHRLPTLLVMDKPSMLLGSILSRDVKGPLTDVDAWRPDDPVRTYGLQSQRRTCRVALNSRLRRSNVSPFCAGQRWTVATQSRSRNPTGDGRDHQDHKCICQSSMPKARQVISRWRDQE